MSFLSDYMDKIKGDMKMLKYGVLWFFFMSIELILKICFISIKYEGIL